ncbi:hypothetical protein Tco_0970683 [Tanacetum coccineum]
MWNDNWCTLGNLKKFISNIMLFDARIEENCSIADMIENGIWNWPPEWDTAGKMIDFSVKNAWWDMRDKQNSVSWWKIVVPSVYRVKLLKRSHLSPLTANGLPDILLATSSSGSVHAFLLGLAVDQRSKRSSAFLGSVIPDTVSDALDSAHHVLHNAVSPGVKSYVVIHKVKQAGDSSKSESTSFRATISIITYNGYFLEYFLNINHRNESCWTMDREFNLLTAIQS